MKVAVPMCLLLGGVVLTVVPARATTDANPYGKIVARNLFALKDPPPPPDPESVKPPAPPISLQGFTTLLGRNQVLFKVNLPAKPPQPAMELSKIMAEGERDGDITVLEINLAEHSVKFDNHGTIEVKNLKDHAAKPGGGSAPLVAGVVPSPGVPGGHVQVINAPAPSATAGMQPIPSRQTRTSTVGDGTPLDAATAAATTPTSSRFGLVQRQGTGAMTPGSTAAFQAAASRTPEENAILFQANKMKNDQLRASGVKLPRLPNHPLLKDQIEPTPSPTTPGQ